MFFLFGHIQFKSTRTIYILNQQVLDVDIPQDIYRVELNWSAAVLDIWEKRSENIRQDE